MSEDSVSQKQLGRTAFELKRILLETPSVCPICRLVAESLRQHVEWLFYERVNDVDTREAIREAGGFCRYHGRLVSRQADALGSALIFKDVLTNELRALTSGRFDRPPRTGGSFARLFDQTLRTNEVRAPCPLCDTERKSEQIAVDSLFEGLSDPEFVAAFCGSTSLCLPHLRLGYTRSPGQAAWQTVLEKEIAVLESMTEELADLARTFDYRFKDQHQSVDVDVWRRALQMTSGWLDE